MSSELELRILSGCHAGARASVRGGESIGAADDCDLVLTDIGIGEDVVAWLQLHAGRWSLASEQASMTAVFAADADESAPQEAAGTSFGSVAFVGELAITVCSPETPWQQVPQQRVESKVRDASPVSKRIEAAAVEPEMGDAESVSNTFEALAQNAETASKVKVTKFATKQQTGTGIKPWWVISVALLVLLCAVLWNILQKGVHPVETAPAASDAQPLDTARQQQLVRNAQLVVASVDPTLRLKIDPLSDGGIRISGWVASVDQLDRLAEKLSALRPMPQLSVRMASDVLDDFKEAARNAGIVKPDFELLGSGKVKVKGLVSDVPARDKALQTLRAGVPSNLEMEDGLRVAASQGPVLQQWLRAAGFPGASAQWNDGVMQLTLPLEPQERPRLENLLARRDVPLTDIPFTLNVQYRVPSESKTARTAPAPELIHISKAPLPFRVTSVIGGVNPYVILADGGKLQPGGQRNGWRLDAVDTDRVTFSGPKTLVLAR